MATGLGIIGCGRRLGGLLRGLPGMGKAIRLATITDPSEQSMQWAKDNFPPGFTVYDDYKDLVKDPDIAWVAVGSWNCYHKEHVLAAAKAGKHIFCEKPLATTLKDCLAMRKAVEDAGVIFSIGFTLRYSPHYVQLKALLDKGVIGDIISMEFNETLNFNHGGYIHADWRRLTKYAGTHLLEKCCHDIDLVNWMIGSTAVRASSFGGCDFFTPKNKKHQKRIGKSPKGETAYKAWWGPQHKVNPFTAKKDIVDNQVAIVEYANGVRTTFHTNCNAGIPERRMYICGTEGTIRADVITGTIEVGRIGWNESIEDKSTRGKGGHGGGDAVLVKDLARSITRNAPPRTGLEDGLRAAITCFGIDKAMNTGRVVDLTPLWKRADLKIL